MDIFTSPFETSFISENQRDFNKVIFNLISSSKSYFVFFSCYLCKFKNILYQLPISFFLLPLSLRLFERNFALQSHSAWRLIEKHFLFLFPITLSVSSSQTQTNRSMTAQITSNRVNLSFSLKGDIGATVSILKLLTALMMQPCRW